MNLDKTNRLEQEYQEGKTSLAEERHFFKEQASDGRFKAWAQFSADRRVTPPSDLLQKLGREIDSRQPKTRHFFIRAAAVAASIALLMMFFFNRPTNQAMTYDEKAAMLEEVLKILPEETNNSEYIIYEDALLVIYLETK